MIYAYRCKSCRVEFDVVKRVAEIDNVEHCPECKAVGERYLTPCQFFGEKVEHAEFNPAFGCVVNGKKHRDELAKRHGLVEVGTEKPEKIHQKFHKDREEKINSRYDEITDNRIRTVSCL